jgi:4-hydroxyphenylpyruvate dioxygenase
LEAAPGRGKSQVATYVEAHDGPGAQHVAFRTRDIVQAVSTMGAALEFLSTPATYYDSLEDRVGPLAELDILRRLGILVDRDASGVLLQIFTRPISSRPTLFLEVIERRGAVGFGSGNVKALFQAVERAQAV